MRQRIQVPKGDKRLAKSRSRGVGKAKSATAPLRRETFGEYLRRGGKITSLPSAMELAKEKQ